jgi:hypothetical protein
MLHNLGIEFSNSLSYLKPLVSSFIVYDPFLARHSLAIFTYGDLVVQIGTLNSPPGFLSNPINGILSLAGIRLSPEQTRCRSLSNVLLLTWSFSQGQIHVPRITCTIPALPLF